MTTDHGRDVVVLGMHRSGTSALAGSLGHLGLSLGPKDALLPATDDNRKGYSENLHLVEVSDWLLHQQGAAWWNPVGFNPSSIDLKNRKAAVEAYAEVLGGFPAACSRLVKDPRLCLTLDVLLPAFRDPLIVFIWREPDEVAVSIHTRDKFPRYVGYALWEYYNVAAARAARLHTSIVVAYGDLVDNPEASLKRVTQFLRSHGVSLRDPHETEAAVAFISKDVRRSPVDPAAAEELKPARLSLLVDVLREGRLETLTDKPVSASSLTVLNDFAIYQGVLSSLASDLRNIQTDARQLRTALATQTRNAQQWQQRALRAEARLSWAQSSIRGDLPTR